MNQAQRGALECGCKRPEPIELLQVQARHEFVGAKPRFRKRERSCLDASGENFHAISRSERRAVGFVNDRDQWSQQRREERQGEGEQNEEKDRRILKVARTAGCGRL